MQECNVIFCGPITGKLKMAKRRLPKIEDIDRSIKKIETLVIPGTKFIAEYHRDGYGSLRKISISGRTYLDYDEETRLYDNDFVRVTEIITPTSILRYVNSPHGDWCEKYLWDKEGIVTFVDNVRVIYDDHRRVKQCKSSKGIWEYGYTDVCLSEIKSTFGNRYLEHDSEGRTISGRGFGYGKYQKLTYDKNGERRDVPELSPRYNTDEEGRLWSILDGEGNIEHIFLWDGHACLGRIDGGAPAPLAAVFSLDTTGTPVRVILRERVDIIPRDAYGEFCTRHKSIPGLFGGTVYKGFVYYRSRTLDTKTGSFTSRDPLDGSENDPRRSTGYRGAVPVESEKTGLYCVCQYNPLSRIDIYGEHSHKHLRNFFTFLMALSDVTWAYQNNALGWLGLEGVINLWGSTFTGQLDRFGWHENVYSERTGIYGILRDGATAYEEKAWTFQHIIHGRREHFDELADIQVFNPKGWYQPNYYCNALLVEPKPDTGNPASFLLRGSRTIGNAQNLPGNWSRNGGVTVPTVPGSSIPMSPSGGFHFGAVDGVSGPINGTLSEVRPCPPFITGTLDSTITTSINTTGTNINNGDRILLTDDPGNMSISTVTSSSEDDDNTSLELDGLFGGIGNANVDIRELTIQDTEDLSIGVNAGRLDCSGATRAYQNGDSLFITQDTYTTAATVNRLEAMLNLDLAIVPAATLNFTLHTMNVSGTNEACKLDGNPNIIVFDDPADSKPSLGDQIEVNDGGGNTVGAIVTATPDDVTRTVDRDLSGLGVAGDDVNWRPLIEVELIGTGDVNLTGGPDIIYNSLVAGVAPANGYIRIADSTAPTPLIFIRSITGVNRDEIQVSPNIGGDNASPYTIERYTVIVPADPVPYDDRIVTVSWRLTLDDADQLDTIADADALQLHQFNDTNLNAALPGTPGTLPNVDIADIGGIWTGTTTVNWPTAGTTGNDIVPNLFCYISDGGGNAGVGIIDTIRISLVFQQNVTVSSEGLQLVPLGGFGLVYNAERRDVNIVTIVPQLIGTEQLQMPHFNENEFVQITGNAGALNSLYRVTAVRGLTLTLSDDANLPPAPIANLQVQRFVPVDPNTSGTRIAINGTPVGGDNGDGTFTTDTITFDTWDIRPLFDQTTNDVAVVDGDSVLAARVQNPPAAPFNATITFVEEPALTGNNLTIDAGVGNNYATGFTSIQRRDGDSVLIEQNFTQFSANGNTVYIVPLCKENSHDGELNSGTTRPPEGIDEWEFNRRDSLIEHELIHTRQCLQWGPILLGAFPVGALEGILEGTTDLETEVSEYVSGEIKSEGGRLVLDITNPGDVEFNEGDTVQVSQNNRTTTHNLPSRIEGNKFRWMTTIIRPGNVNLRKLRSDSAVHTERFINTLGAFTAGGVLNLLTGTHYGGIFWLIAKFGTLLKNAKESTRGIYCPVTVEENGKKLVLSTIDHAVPFRSGNRIIVKSGDATVLRTMTIEGLNILLSNKVNYTENVEVAPYSTHDPGSFFSWFDYYPATIDDPNRPAQITVHSVGGEFPSIDLDDKVEIIHGEQSIRTLVSRKVSETIFEVEDIPFSDSMGVEFRVAKVGHQDPLSWWDSFFLEEMNMGWMQWLFDFWGELDHTVHPRADSPEGWVSHTWRYLFGTQSWSALPVLGWWMWDNAFKQIGDNGHLSFMEQEASEESGDLYSPMCRLQDSITVVGDIGRMWYFPWGGGRRSQSIVWGGQQDSPGIHYRDDMMPRWLPLRNETVPEAERRAPNEGFESPRASGLSLSDTLTRRNWTTAGTAMFDPGTNAPCTLFINAGANDNIVFANRTNPQPRLNDQIEINDGNGNSVDATVTAVPDNVTIEVGEDLSVLGVTGDPVNWRPFAEHDGFMPSDLAVVPATPGLERCGGCYVAFTRDGEHRLTTRNPWEGNWDFDSLQKALAVHDNPVAMPHQPIFSEVTVADVDVECSNFPIENNAIITLLVKQRATITINPNGDRQYAVTVPDPANDDFLRQPENRIVRAWDTPTPATAPRPLEISRVYRRTAPGSRTERGTFDANHLNIFGLHIFNDLYIPVRLFSIAVVNTVQFKSSVPSMADIISDFTTNDITEITLGDDAFLLIPAETTLDQVTLSNIDWANPVAPGTDNPEWNVEQETVSSDLTDYIDEGRILKISFPDDNPPPEVATLTFTIAVGDPGNTTDVNSVIILRTT